jgi:flagellin FlaB
MRKMTKIFNKDEGFTGLEAAIVLIAFVVVAAVFSYVVLGAGFFTTQKAQQVIYTSVDQASSSVEIMGDVYGINLTDGAVAPYAGYNYIRFTVGLTSGGSPVDFSQTTMAYSSQNYNDVEYLENANTRAASPITAKTTPAEVTDVFIRGGITEGQWGVVLINNGGTSTDLLLENQEQFVIYANPTPLIIANEKINLEISPAVGTSYVVARKAPARVGQVDALY